MFPTPPEGVPELLPRYSCIVYSDYTDTKYSVRRQVRIALPVQLIYLILLYLNYESMKLELSIHHPTMIITIDNDGMVCTPRECSRPFNMPWFIFIQTANCTRMPRLLGSDMVFV